MTAIFSGGIHSGSPGPSWPGAQDTYETKNNGANPAPDSDTRLDAEIPNDAGAYLTHITSVLGDDPRNGYASVQAAIADLLSRVAALEP